MHQGCMRPCHAAVSAVCEIRCRMGTRLLAAIRDPRFPHLQLSLLEELTENMMPEKQAWRRVPGPQRLQAAGLDP